MSLDVPVAKTAPISLSKDELLSYDRSLSHDGSWTRYEKEAEVSIQFSKKGTASKEKSPPMILHDLFLKAVKLHGNKPALYVEADVPQYVEGKTIPPPLEISKWKKWTYSEYYNECRAAAKAFIKFGFAQHDAVTVFGFNSPQWFMSQWAAQFAGGKVSGVYPSDSPDQVQYKALYSDSSIATCEGKKELDSFASTINHLPYLKAIICWSYQPKQGEAFLTRSDGSKVPVLAWSELIAIGSKESEDELDNRIKNQKPGHCCALVFTSGTTGNPKATMLSHDNIVFEIYSILYDGVPDAGNQPEAERFISYLPLSHIAGMMVDIICPMAVSAFKPAWGEAYFARPYDLKAGSLGDRLRTIQPTIFLGVPRVWEKVAEKIQAIGAQNNALVKMIGDFAKARGLDYQMNRQLGGNGEKPFGYFIASRISSKIKEALGLQHCKFALSGAAPLALETQKYFASLGININEAYGMSECTGATTWSTESCHLWGSVGYGLPGMEVKIFKVDDKGAMTECPRAKDVYRPTETEQGEVCFRGRHIMMGYLANPKLGEEHVHEMIKKNKEAIDEMDGSTLVIRVQCQAMGWFELLEGLKNLLKVLEVKILLQFQLKMKLKSFVQQFQMFK